MACFNVNSGVTTWIREIDSEQKILVDGLYIYDCRFCGEYALYYLNARGGWDSFLIEGKVVRKDKVTNYDYTKSFDNTTIEFGKTRYAAEIEPQYECHTGYLTDIQSDNLARNLLTSQQVYLHNLVNDKIIPVLITDSNVEHKTVRNNGDKMVAYTINLVESQQRFKK